MSVGIVMVTHEQLGAQLSAIAATIFGNAMTPLANVAIPANISTQQLGSYAGQSLPQLCETAASGGRSGIRKGRHAQPTEIESHIALQSNE